MGAVQKKNPENIVPVQYFVEIALKTSLFSKGHCESPRASLHSYLDMCLSRDKPYSMKPTFMIWYVPYSMCLSKRQNKRGSWLFAGARDKIRENWGCVVMRALDNNQSVTSNFDCVIKSTNTMGDSGLWEIWVFRPGGILLIRLTNHSLIQDTVHGRWWTDTIRKYPDIYSPDLKQVNQSTTRISH